MIECTASYFTFAPKLTMIKGKYSQQCFGFLSPGNFFMFDVKDGSTLEDVQEVTQHLKK